MKQFSSRFFLVFLVVGLICSAVMIPACGRSGRNSQGVFPEGFNNMSDREKVVYMMENASPDSVARFICLAALGKIPGVKIDTVAMATLYAYENYTDTTLARFSSEYDQFVNDLALADRMRFYKLAGEIDPQGLGYDLGLHYVDQIREKKMTAKEVKGEIEEFRKACADDADTFNRFLIGFKTVLNIDKGKDLSQEIYTTFINYE